MTSFLSVSHVAPLLECTNPYFVLQVSGGWGIAILIPNLTGTWPDDLDSAQVSGRSIACNDIYVNPWISRGGLATST